MTDLERQVAFEVAQLGIAPHVKRRERHLVFELSHPLTREQVTWLDEHEGKLFDRYHCKDELEAQLSRQPADVVVQLDIRRRARGGMPRFNDIRIEGALSQVMRVGNPSP